ncbi:MAG TPA: hypothetical protein VFE36_13105 [Candidatus Baltobacteraceae bacterium]|jgi:hypothetical protein|nr:hypothetical protein [Candidatus Baltobacteraceae bacterium]
MTAIFDQYLGLAGDAINVLVGQGTGVMAQRIEQYALIGDQIAITLRENGERQAADVAEMLGSRVHATANYLRTRDGRRMWSDAQDAFSGRGWVIGGAGLLTGFLAARAIRTSPPLRYDRP